MVRCSFPSAIMLSCFSVGVMGQYENCTGQLKAINDGRCDSENNIVNCGFDGGDCCDCSCANDRIYPCGVWDFNCLDHDAIDNANGCTSETTSVSPCATDISQAWVIHDTASAASLAEAVNCSGGTFNVLWKGNVILDHTINVPDDTTVYVTGEGLGAEVNGGGKRRLFTVRNAALHIEGLILSGGSATYGGAIAAVHSNTSFDQTSFIGNIASSYGGAVYLGRSSSVAWDGETNFTDNHCRRGGGAVAVSMNSKATWSGSTKFSNNTDSGDGGGAIYLNNHSNLSWDGVTSFINNTATSGGGALFVDGKSIASWDGMVSFAGNAADNGGALFVQGNSTILWGGIASFVDNAAKFGGALSVNEHSSVFWSSETCFSNNTASLHGGALFVVRYSSVSWIGGAFFIKNTASYNGGALYIANNANASWYGVATFAENSASTSGGALFVYKYSTVFLEGNVSFVQNTADYGGALYIELYSTVLWGEIASFVDNAAKFGGALSVNEHSSVFWSSETCFSNNTASLHGGALFVVRYSSVSWIGGAFFIKNTASYNGGALYIANNANASWDGVATFAENSASTSGGALFVYKCSTVFLEGNVSFVQNTADYGGALYIANFSTVLWDGIASFVENAAMNLGGTLFVSFHSNVSWTSETIFVENIAEFGGVLYIEYKSIVSWDGVTSFIDNAADYVGAVSVGVQSVVSWTAKTSFFNNSALKGSGGALRVRFDSSASWNGKTTFTANSASSSGGAVYASTGSNITIGGDTHFYENDAAADGGAVYIHIGYNEVVNSHLVINNVVALSLHGNNCGGNGGGIALIGAVVTRFPPNMFFSGNSAGVAGGAVHLSGVSFGPYFNHTKFSSNSAVVGGGVFATGSGTATIGDEDEELQYNPTIFNMCEFIGNDATNTGGALNTGAGIDTIENTYFVHNTATIGGALRLVGTASLAGCTFMDNLSDDNEGPGVFNDGVISGVSNCSFARNVFNCDPGSYLDYKETDAVFDTICKGCGKQCEGCAIEGQEPMCLRELDHSSAAGGIAGLESLSINHGYWRATKTSIDILACYNAKACMGGITDEDDYCLEGYKGPYCSVCKQGYTPSLGAACTKCSDTMAGSIAIAVFVAIVLFSIFIAFLSYMISGKSEDVDQGIVARMTRYIPLQSVKIVIVVWQILTQFSTVANVVFPSVYQDFLDGVDILNFNLRWMVSVGCIIDTDFHDQLLFATLGPLVAVAILGGTYAAAIHRTDMPEDARRIICRKYVSMVLLLTFLVYSSVSSTLFKMFACDELGDGKIYLRADYRIECDASKHNTLEIYAGFMVLLYVVGIPAFYGVLLYSNREALTNNAGRDEDESIKPITDLWKPYKPERFYYEVIECVRRVVLTGALVFIYPNTAAQIAAALMLATFFMVLNETLAPHASLWDIWCGRMGHAIVFKSIFLALMLKVDVSGEPASSQRVFEWVLVAAHSCLVLIVVIEAVAMVLSWREEIGENNEPRVCLSLGSFFRR